MKRTPRATAYTPKPRTLRVPPDHYQPRKAEKEEETDMPGMSPDTPATATGRGAPQAAAAELP